jgi:hypothetical protein
MSLVEALVEALFEVLGRDGARRVDGAACRLSTTERIG